jgi:lipid-binding SYLF domain-containing protein
MTERHHSWLWQGTAIGLVVVALLVMGIPPAAADDALEAKQLVEKARFTLENFMADPNMEVFREQLKKAKGVFIAPQLLKGAFIIGGQGGSGVFLVRDEKTGQWSNPAFYTVGGVSFGLQAGGEAAEVVLLVMSERGVSPMLRSNFKLGADASVAAGPVGIGVGGATAELSADILAFSRAKGLYGGLSLEGSVVAVRDKWNNAYYGKSVMPADILVRREAKNPASAELVNAVTKAVRAG